jgi:titin
MAIGPFLLAAIGGQGGVKVCGAPGTLSLSAGGTSATQIALSWSAPSDTGGGTISGYRIKKDGVVLVADTGSTGTTYTATGLTRVTSYNFNVAAINEAGTGADGNTPSLTTSAEVPGAPGTLSLSNGSTSGTMIALSWSAPSDTGGGNISGYRIKKDGVVLVADTGSTGTTYTATGLTRLTSYNFTVAAINEAGTGTDGNTPSHTTTAEVPGAPGTLSLSAGSPNTTVINLSWSAPSDNGGGTVSGYKIQKKTTGSWSNVVADTGSTSTTYSATGLTEGTTYYFRVAAINGQGAGAYGNEPNRTTVEAFAATGGTISTYTGYKAHTFTSSGSFTVTGGSHSVDVLVIAGGAGGGRHATGSGGGGAGGFRTNTSVAVSSTGSGGGGVYTVTIGGGGSGTNSNMRGFNGGGSSWDTGGTDFSATGGGAGAGSYYSANNGGSGGGGSAQSNTGGSGTAGQGNDGGDGAVIGGEGSGGGGGGAAAAGSTGPYGGLGGNGAQNSYRTGSNERRGGGGGGNGDNYSGAGPGGSGGGGDAHQTGTASSGTANTGGGGGASSAWSSAHWSGSGGSGIVIVRYTV